MCRSSYLRCDSTKRVEGTPPWCPAACDAQSAEGDVDESSIRLKQVSYFGYVEFFGLSFNC